MSSNIKSLLYAALLCIICGSLLTTVSIGLQSYQERNVLLDQYSNLLKSVGLFDESVEYSEQEAVAAMVLVRQNGLARTNGSGRSDKHRHILNDALGLDLDQQALLAVMMLRGPQSAGELKTRTDRYTTSQGTGFDSPDDVRSRVEGLATRVAA